MIESLEQGFRKSNETLNSNSNKFELVSKNMNSNPKIFELPESLALDKRSISKSNIEI